MNYGDVWSSPAVGRLLCDRAVHTCGGGLCWGWVGSIPGPAGPPCYGPPLPHTPALLTIQLPLHMTSGASCPPWLWDRVSEEEKHSEMLEQWMDSFLDILTCTGIRRHCLAKITFSGNHIIQYCIQVLICWHLLTHSYFSCHWKVQEFSMLYLCMHGTSPGFLIDLIITWELD